MPHPRKNTSDWALVPATTDEIDAVRRKCRRLVMRRAAISAGVAAVPIPGLDIATDIGMLTSLIDDINVEFGLTPGQINRLQSTLRLAAYEIVVGMGSALAGKVVTRKLAILLLKRTGRKLLVKYSAKIVPIACQGVSAAIGFAAFRTIGYQHIDACAEIAAELVVLRAKTAH